MTDNTEAVEKLAVIIENETNGSSWYPNVSAAQAILAAIQADPLAYVKPKPLEWDFSSPRRARFVPSKCGMYEIVIAHNHYQLKIGATGNSSEHRHPDFEAAQAAAETHRNEMLAKEFEQ